MFWRKAWCGVVLALVVVVVVVLCRPRSAELGPIFRA